jgi:hypothetical protein
MKRYFRIVKKLDDRKFKPLPKGSGYKYLEKQCQQLQYNCWSMFPGWNRPRHLWLLSKILGIPRNNGKFSVTDFAWTNNVEEAFRNHPYHKRFLKKHEKNFSVGMFLLDILPATYIKENKKEITPIEVVSTPSKTTQTKTQTKIENKDHIMTKGDMCQLLEDDAIDYLKTAQTSMERNEHMHSFRGKYNKKFATAVLVNYINYVANGQGMDLGLQEKHLLAE